MAGDFTVMHVFGSDGFGRSLNLDLRVRVDIVHRSRLTMKYSMFIGDLHAWSERTMHNRFIRPPDSVPDFAAQVTGAGL